MNKDIKEFPGAYIYGNKGAMWANEAHLAMSGHTTLCGIPMLAFNHVMLNGITKVGCEECAEKYKEIEKFKSENFQNYKEIT
jgi:hypothetical protein